MRYIARDRAPQLSTLYSWLILIGIATAVYVWKLSAASAFLLGGLLSFLIPISTSKEIKTRTKHLLPIAIVGIGAGLDSRLFSQLELGVIMSVLGSVLLVFFLGWGIRKKVSLEGTWPLLITIGTAICGATAIASVIPILKPKEEDVVKALGVIFLLNAIALQLFPAVGHWLQLTDYQFGIWTAIAVHDTSSVAGASLKYSELSFQIAILLKLLRATFIVPLCFYFMFKTKTDQPQHMSATIPLIFVGLMAMTTLTSLFPGYGMVWSGITTLAKTCLVIVIFCMGLQTSQISFSRKLFGPLLFGVVLWASVSSVSVTALITMLR